MFCLTSGCPSEKMFPIHLRLKPLNLQCFEVPKSLGRIGEFLSIEMLYDFYFVFLRKKLCSSAIPSKGKIQKKCSLYKNVYFVNCTFPCQWLQSSILFFFKLPDGWQTARSCREYATTTVSALCIASSTVAVAEFCVPGSVLVERRVDVFLASFPERVPFPGGWGTCYPLSFLGYTWKIQRHQLVKKLRKQYGYFELNIH